MEASDHKRYAFIGSSPISLLKAYLLGKKEPNSEILIFDKNDQIGGAWYSEISPKGYEIECGCHIWSYTPEVYNFLEDEFDLKLEKLRPDALFVGKNIKIPYSTKNTIDTYKFILKNLLTLKFGRLKEIRNNPGLRTRIIGKRNKYPQNGSPELTRSLISRLHENPRIQIYTNETAHSIKIGTEIVVSLENRNEIFNQVYLTSVSEIKRVELPNKTIDIKNRQVDYIHFLLSLNKPLRKKLFYWRLISDPVIHRISDISYQTNHEENLLLIGIKGAAFESNNEAELLEHCRKVLLSYGLINDTFSTELVKTHIFPTYYIEEELRNEINAVPHLELIHSTDVMYGMYYLLKKEGLI